MASHHAFKLWLWFNENYNLLLLGTEIDEILVLADAALKESSLEERGLSTDITLYIPDGFRLEESDPLMDIISRDHLLLHGEEEDGRKLYTVTGWTSSFSKQAVHSLTEFMSRYKLTIKNGIIVPIRRRYL